MLDQSPAARLVDGLVASLGKDTARRVLDVALSKFSTVELAALASHWEFWARTKQLAPRTYWRTWGFLTGRGFGKTLACSKHINDEVQDGRAMLICLVAQDEQSAIDIQVLGPSGLIATAPPWFRPHWEASAMQLVWPNGARAYVRTPEVPGKIRGLEYHLAWCSELQSWPIATRDEAWSNVQLSVRLGYARIIWDSTPKMRHPILKELLADAEANPTENPVVRGTTYENASNLGDGYVARLERKYGGTQKGKEELSGEMLDDDEGAIAKQEWIDSHRCGMLPLVRRVISVDPAVTKRGGSDQTGIADVGLTRDARALVLGDHSGKYSPPEWGAKVVDLYVSGGCDLVVIETNKGGDLLTSNIVNVAEPRGLKVVLVDDKWRPHRVAGVIFVREIYSRGPKEDRARPLSTAYERGRIWHVEGVDLTKLEETVTTWIPMPGRRSPDRLDALVGGVVEVLGLDDDEPDLSQGFRGLQQLAQGLVAPTRSALVPGIASFIGGAPGGRI